MDLKGKVAAVTGASRGLGKEIARALSEKGAKVFLISRDSKALFRVSEEIGGVPIEADITDENQIKVAFEKMGSERLDILVNNSGVWVPYDNIEELDIGRVRKMFEVNVFGLIACSKEAYLKMKSQGSGTIVNILSTAALKPQTRSPAYASSKFAADGFSRSLAILGEADGVSVISVYPGGMRTNFHDERKPSEWGEFMDPKDVAEKIVGNLERENPERELVLKRPEK